MIWKYLLRPALFTLPAESAHEFAMGVYSILARVPGIPWLMKQTFYHHDQRLALERFGVRFNNCVGLAAGFDKNARWFNELALLGFGHIEVGTLTGQSQPGNDKPRLFRIKQDQGLINRMGFNNLGSQFTADRLQNIEKKCTLGINIGKTKTVPIEEAEEDYLASFERLYSYADYFTVNVSSPNTPNLRALQDREPLCRLLNAIQLKNLELADQKSTDAKPILLKIAPDLTDEALQEIAEIAIETQIQGIIATNTTVSREGLRTAQSQLTKIGAGGVSGAPLTEVSRLMVSKLFLLTEGKIPIFGVGGIMNPEDAWNMICHGATLVQLYSGFIYGGPFFTKSVLKHLSKMLDQHGLNTIESAIGRDLN